MENPIKMDEIGGTTILGNPHIKMNASFICLLLGSVFQTARRKYVW